MLCTDAHMFRQASHVGCACMQFTAVPQSIGAPLRTVTVRDAIADLPAIHNGHDQDEMEYSGTHLPIKHLSICPCLPQLIQ